MQPECQEPGLWGPCALQAGAPTLTWALQDEPPADTRTARSPRCAQLQPRQGSPELPAQFLEEEGDGEQAQGGPGGEDTGPVVLQVPPQPAGEGLLDKGAGGRGRRARDGNRHAGAGERAGLPPLSPGLFSRVTPRHPGTAGARTQGQALQGPGTCGSLVGSGMDGRALHTD